MILHAHKEHTDALSKTYVIIGDRYVIIEKDM